MVNYYILNGKEPVALEDSQLDQWIDWLMTHDRTVSKTFIKPRKPITKGNPKALRTINWKRSQSYFVSTIFLAVDHSFSFCDCTPILFETMVFSDDSFIDLYCNRYSSYDDALQGHQEVTELVLRGLIYNEQETG